MAKKGLYNPKKHPHMLKLLRVKHLYDKEIYTAMGISYQTFYRWLKKHKEFQEAYDCGSEIIVSNAISNTVKRCTGFEYEEVIQEIETDNKGNVIRKHMKKTKKYFPPNPELLKFVLTHLAPDMFADSINVKHSGTVTKEHKLNVDNLTEEELLLISKLEIEDDTTA